MSSASTRQASSISWRLGICAALAMTLLSLIPQFHLWIVRGRDWQGTSVSFDFDEVAYASYLNALIDGRPRRNDPYTGRDDRHDRPQPESLHSIQFVAAYAAAIPARLLGLSTGTTFIIIRGVSAFAATLAIFWLLSLLIGDARIAAAGAVIILCLGGIAGEAHDFWRIGSFREAASRCLSYVVMFQRSSSLCCSCCWALCGKVGTVPNEALASPKHCWPD